MAVFMLKELGQKMDRNLFGIKGLDLGLKKGRGRVFLIFQMPHFPQTNIFIFLAVNLKTTLLDYAMYFVTILSVLLVSVAPAFDSHWLEECANLRRYTVFDH
jgi:hypothetical protein